MTIHKILTVRQPWADLIVRGIKPVENRSWTTTYRGPLLIHAAARPIVDNELIYGAVIGAVDLIDIVTDHPSPYFEGPYGWVLSRPRYLKQPLPLRGRLGLYEITAKFPRNAFQQEQRT